MQERFSGRTSFIDPNNLAISRSVGDYDRPQYLVLGYIYEFPVGQGKRWISRGVPGRILGNWQLSSITTFGKGLPIVITGPNNTRLPGVSAAAVRFKSPLLPEGQQSIDRWSYVFWPCSDVFTGKRLPHGAQPAHARRRYLGSGAQPQPARPRKHPIAVPGGVLQRAQYAPVRRPERQRDATNFGQITSAGGARVIQLGLRLAW